MTKEKNVIHLIDAEILASKKAGKPIYLNFVKEAENYKAIAPFKVEGEYILNAKGIVDQAVILDYKEDSKTVEMEFDSKEEEIRAFLTKDESSILKAIKQNIRVDQFREEPSFIIGPPGTGKTKVITKIIEEGIKANKKILIASPTNLAVENVFERIDDKGLKDEIVLTIKTESEDLQQFSPEAIKNRKLKPIKDEIDILLMAQDGLLKQKRDSEPILNSAKIQKEDYNTFVINLKMDLAKLQKKYKFTKEQLNETTYRINSLTGNVFLKSVANIFMSGKVEELESLKQEQLKELGEIEKNINSINKKIAKKLKDEDSVNEQFNQAVAKKNEAENALAKIAKRLKELREEQEKIKSGNVFKDAKIIGATLVNASLNQKIQSCEFDIIIVDEASMALVPLLLVASQPLANKALPKIVYEDDKSLYTAQNRAVEMALNKKLIFVGDPKQLQPIAVTTEMRKTIFELYEVEKIFEGNEVKNCVFLDINFRNHPSITKMASDMFYGGMLKSGKKDDEKSSLYIRRSTSKMVNSKKSYINYGNMKIVVSQIAKALKRGRRNIGVITPYRSQALLISENIATLKEEYSDADIQVGTVHTFQGKEKSIIIFDITFSPNDSSIIPATYNGDINSNTAKLLNVAMTRAEDFFIVVGDADGILSKMDKSFVLREWVEKIQVAS